MAAATLCGLTNAADAPRSICAMGHKWMWNDRSRFPPEEFLVASIRCSPVSRQVQGRYQTSNKIAGRLSAEWAAKLGLNEGIPIPVGAFDAHWDAIGAGCKEGDVVNVVGTSTCRMAIMPGVSLIQGVCGVVPGSIHPSMTGVEAGLSATGDIFDSIARRAGTTVAALSQGLDQFRAGQTGLLRPNLDNGDRTVVGESGTRRRDLVGNFTHTAQDELFAAIEGPPSNTRHPSNAESGGVPFVR